MLTKTGKPRKLHICIACDYSTHIICNMRKHLLAKRPCASHDHPSYLLMKEKYLVKKDTGTQEHTSGVSCPHCNKHFKWKTSIYKHKCKQIHSNLASTVSDLHKAVDTLRSFTNSVNSVNEKSQNCRSIPLCNKPSTGTQTLLEHHQYTTTCCINQDYKVQIPFWRNEWYYQRVLEAHLGGTHKHLASGITDITTDLFHAEIKNFKAWKSAIGQLICYNKWDPKPELRIYLFGSLVSSALIAENIKLHNIRLFVITDTPNGISIKDTATNADEHISVCFV